MDASCLGKRSLWRSEQTFEVQEVGAYGPQPIRLDALETGEVGFVIAGIKDIHQTQVGDTMTDARAPCAEPLSGFKEVQPMVFSGVFRWTRRITKT